MKLPNPTGLALTYPNGNLISGCNLFARRRECQDTIMIFTTLNEMFTWHLVRTNKNSGHLQIRASSPTSPSKEFTLC